MKFQCSLLALCLFACSQGLEPLDAPPESSETFDAESCSDVSCLLDLFVLSEVDEAGGLSVGDRLISSRAQRKTWRTTYAYNSGTAKIWERGSEYPSAETTRYVPGESCLLGSLELLTIRGFTSDGIWALVDLENFAWAGDDECHTGAAFVISTEELLSWEGQLAEEEGTYDYIANSLPHRRIAFGWSDQERGDLAVGDRFNPPEQLRIDALEEFPGWVYPCRLKTDVEVEVLGFDSNDGTLVQIRDDGGCIQDTAFFVDQAELSGWPRAD